MPVASPQPKPRRRFWRRWLRRFFWLGVWGVLVLAGGLWWGYHQRVHLANQALARLGPYQAQLEALDLSRDGRLVVKGLVVRDRTTGAGVLRLPRLEGRVGWADLRQRRIAEIILEKPEIEIDPRWWQAGAGPAPVPAPDPAKPPALAGYAIGTLRVVDARVTYHPNARTTAEMNVTYGAEDVAVGADGRIRSGEQELSLSRVRVNTESDGARPVQLEAFHVRGRVRAGVLELDEVSFKQPELHATPTLLAALMGTAAEVRERHAAARPQGGPGREGSSASPVATPLAGVRVKRLEVADAGVAARRFTAGNPLGLVLPESEVRFTYRTSDLEWMFGQNPVMEGHSLELNYLSIAAPENKGHLRVKEATVKVAKIRPGEPLHIEALHLQEPQVRWTPELRQLLVPARATPSAGGSPARKDTAPPKAAETPWPGLRLDHLTLNGADVAWRDPGTLSFFLELKGALRVAQMRVDSRGWQSGERQELEVRQVRLTFPPGVGGKAPSPWLELPRGELVLVPDAWNDLKRVERLALEKPVVRLRDGNTPWLPLTVDPALAGPPDPVPMGPPPPEVEPPPVAEAGPPSQSRKAARSEPGPPWWQQLNFGDLVVRAATVDLLGSLPQPLDLRGGIHIITDGDFEDGPLHRVRLEGFTASLPTLSRLPFPVVQAATMEAGVRLPDLWTERRIEELKLSGVSVDAGEPLMKFFENPGAANSGGSPAAPPGAAGPEPAKGAAWQVGSMSVAESQVTISNLIPGLSSVKFGVAFQAQDLPLSPEGLSTHVAKQRVELANLRVPSPYEPLRPVAELDSVFLTFSLGGLMRKEIDKVEIVSPSLYVGEDLFWYVDYYRKYVMEGAKPGMPRPMIVAAGDPAFDQQVAAAVEEAEPPASQAAWSVNTLQVHSGKLIVAPKGKPLRGLRDPFPFNINTQVTRGTLEADLDIPKDTYEIPNLNLQLVNMRGQVKFNLPIKQRDNNLVETFEVDSIRWKGLRTGKAYLTVTYDSAGIYAKFGAEAYDGYVNGEVNVYLDETFNWDGWIGGKNVTTHELTQVLCPGYFILDGRVEATLVAQGNKYELFQADGSFKNHSPGKFTIKALNGLIDDLPKEWDQLQRQLTQIGLETLRDFEYDHAEANCRFYGREGTAKLRFTGPNGSRSFEINVYDHRWTTDKPAADTAGAP